MEKEVKETCLSLRIGEEIPYILKRLGVSHQELVDTAHMSKTTLQRCINGENVRIILLIRLFVALRILIGEEGRENLQQVMVREVKLIC